MVDRTGRPIDRLIGKFKNFKRNRSTDLVTKLIWLTIRLIVLSLKKNWPRFDIDKEENCVQIASKS
jgi:hypothetical protein